MIRIYIETGTGDTRIVRNALGHRHDETTDAYTKLAEDYYRKDQYDWLQAVLKFHKHSKEVYGTTKQVVVHNI